MRTAPHDNRVTTGKTSTPALAQRVRRLVLAAFVAGSLASVPIAIGSQGTGAGAGKTKQLVAAIDAFSPQR
jgi:hypothetical protein